MGGITAELAHQNTAVMISTVFNQQILFTATFTVHKKKSRNLTVKKNRSKKKKEPINCRFATKINILLVFFIGLNIVILPFKMSAIICPIFK